MTSSLRCAIVAACSAILSGCATTQRAAPQFVEAPSLRIGLVADSQLQTRHTRAQVRLLSGKFEDEVVDVSLRPPALNELAEDLAEGLLRQVAAEPRPDLILYLGDAANNGCADELSRAFTIAHRVRDETQVPIYFVVGNHDYLGAGNTTHLTERTKLCDRPRAWTGRSIREGVQEATAKAGDVADSDHRSQRWRCSDPNLDKAPVAHGELGAKVGLENLPVTKFELMRQISCFNRQNERLRSQRRAWRYKDSFEHDEGARLERCIGNPRNREGWIERQHRRDGCFLAAVLTTPHEGGELEVMLVDTSDYADKRTVFSILGVEFFGTTGWISTRSPHSQGRWLADERSPNAALRVIASHYGPEMVGSIMATWPVPRGAVGRLVAMLGTSPPCGSFWFHGHEHEWHAPRTIRKGGIRAFGVGSTTDHGRPGGRVEAPHAAIATLADGALAEPLQRVELPVDCGPTEAALRDFARIRAGHDTYSPVLKLGFWRTAMSTLSYGPGEEADILLGLDKSYRDPEWSVSDEASALQNLAGFIEELAPSADGDVPIACEDPRIRTTHPRCIAQTQVRSCLALRSSRLEKSVRSRWRGPLSDR